MFPRSPHGQPRGYMMQPRVHPTRYDQRHFCCDYVVPEVHPSHTKNIYHHRYNHVHQFPHSESRYDTVSHQHFVGGPGPMAGPGGAPGPGPMAGPGGAPGRRRGWF
ncbi:CotD family spore coat protein [Texcoconibacillus texcoconensis]|uniref:Spore coat protein D n=1 Tax=Texcoconibacillus texcoconensis TaxID=1095777 RepID=A0A840QT74_9BACI|nr:CotD family spore coat protein [Texcoconibacillus texcoconensis]MBB5174513.1 spore coat protein D [Texcoconibacillus texcoconensis]